MSRATHSNPVPSLTLAVLSYNRAAETVRTLRRLLETDYRGDRLRVVLIDNASTDNTAELVEQTFGPRVEILRNAPNIGPVARNRGMLRAETDYVFTFDEDCHPDSPETIRRVVDFLEAHPDLGALCFCCVNAHTGQIEFGHPGTGYRRRDREGTYEGMYLIGGGMAFRRSALHGSQGYDERLRFGGEEYDLALELLRGGVAIAFREDLRILHNEAPRAEGSIRAFELDMRNNIWISVRRFPALLVLPVTLLHITRRLLAALGDRDRRRLRGYLRGIRTAFARLPEFLATRRAVPLSRLLDHRHWLLQMFLARPLFPGRGRDENLDRS